MTTQAEHEAMARFLMAHGKRFYPCDPRGSAGNHEAEEEAFHTAQLALYEAAVSKSAFTSFRIYSTVVLKFPSLDASDEFRTVWGDRLVAAEGVTPGGEYWVALLQERLGEWALEQEEKST